MKSEVSKKEKQWNVLEQKADDTVDALGHPIDPKIKLLLVGLWAHAIPTSASCEGHLSGERPYPWVRVETPPPRAWGEWEAWKDDERKRKIIYRKNIRAGAEVLKFLKDFYRTRTSPQENQLVLSDKNALWGHGELLPKDADLLPLKQKSLDRSQAEIQAFAEFLKKKFFEESKR